LKKNMDFICLLASRLANGLSNTRSKKDAAIYMSSTLVQKRENRFSINNAREGNETKNKISDNIKSKID